MRTILVCMGVMLGLLGAWAQVGEIPGVEPGDPANPAMPVKAPALTYGATLLQSDFDAVAAPGWRAVAGTEWSFLRGRFGDLADSPGPNGLGNWVAAGDPSWTNVRLDAEMSEEMDGAGSIFLTVRYQNPRNFYALEWQAAGANDYLRLIRCKDGYRYLINEAKVPDQKNFPFTLGIAVVGDLLIGYLQDQPVVTGFAGDFAEGCIALGSSERKVLLDNVRARAVTTADIPCRFLRDCRFAYGLKPRYFLRDTGKLEIPFSLTNRGKTAVDRVQVTISFEDPAADVNAKTARALFPAVSMEFGPLAPNMTSTVPFILDTRLLKAGEYLIRTRMTSPADKLSRDEVYRIGIARNWNPERFNYFTWGLPGDDATLQDYVAHGHTMGIGGGRNMPEDWATGGKPVPADLLPKKLPGQAEEGPFHPFDLALKYGMIAGTNLQSTNGRFPAEVYGKDAKGNPTPMPLPFHPTYHDFAVNFARSTAQRYAEYPAFRLMNINTETEYHNPPQYSGLGLEMAKEALGFDPPKECTDMMGIPYNKVPDLAKDGVIDDAHPILQFYRWFWLQGEGYNTLALDMQKAAKEAAPNLFVFHDPAARMPFVRDRHDGITPWDWTYTTPNALTLPFKIEVLRSMGGTDDVCNYVQVLWKGSVFTEKDECPSASIIRLGLLHSMSRPVKAVGHWNTDWMRAPQNRDRWEAVEDLSNTLWKPLGPVLTNLTVPKRKVAFLVSSTNELFCAKSRDLWRKESAYAAWHEAFMRAGLPVDILFEEDVAEGKLHAYSAVFIPFGEVISKSAHAKLVEFAGRGKVVADTYLGFNIPGVTRLQTDLTPLIYANWAWMSVGNKKGITAEDSRQLVWKTTEEIATVFAEELRGAPRASDPWLILTPREYKGVQYLFAVNDKRSAGDQVGVKYGTVLEQGEPLAAQIRTPLGMGGSFVYDLTARQQLAPDLLASAALRWEAQFAPASAKLYALLPQKIAKLEVDVPATVKRGESVILKARLLDPEGKPVQGVLPLRLTLRDSHGASSEYSDYYAFKDGAWQLTGSIALNDAAGTWTVTLDDLAAGLSVTKAFTVSE